MLSKERCIPETPTWGYSAKAGFFFWLQLAAMKVVKHCYEKLEEGKLSSTGRNNKKKVNAARGSCKCKASELRVTFFEWWLSTYAYLWM